MCWNDAFLFLIYCDLLNKTAFSNQKSDFGNSVEQREFEIKGKVEVGSSRIAKKSGATSMKRTIFAN